MLTNITGIIIIDPQFVMNHLDDLDPKRGISWQTVQVSPFSIFLSSPAQFMLAEVQYGGRVTDDFDKRLLNTFTNVWFNDQLLVTGFKFYDGYTLPDCKTVEEYSEFITNLPIQVTLCKSSAPICFQDIPEVFGLHANADITYQINTAKGVLDQVNQCFFVIGNTSYLPQILAVQPKEGGGGEKGESRESIVGRTAADMLAKLPPDYSPHEVKEAIENLGGMLPMNIFLKQEIDRMQRILTLLRSTLTDLGMAIEGTIIMSEDLKEVLDNMFDAKVPAKWTKISWSSSTIGFWFTELLERDSQFKTWCFKGRPKAFWIPGFFNPQVGCQL